MTTEPPQAATPTPALSRDGSWKWVSLGLLLGTTCDAGVGVPMLVAPAFTLATLHLPAAAPETYVRLNGVFLLVLALYYGLTASNPARYVGNVVLAIVGRLAGCAFYVAGALAFDEPAVFYAFAGLNFTLATIHTVTWRRAARA